MSLCLLSCPSWGERTWIERGAVGPCFNRRVTISGENGRGGTWPHLHGTASVYRPPMLMSNPRALLRRALGSVSNFSHGVQAHPSSLVRKPLPGVLLLGKGAWREPGSRRRPCTCCFLFARATAGRLPQPVRTSKKTNFVPLRPGKAYDLVDAFSRWGAGGRKHSVLAAPTACLQTPRAPPSFPAAPHDLPRVAPASQKHALRGASVRFGSSARFQPRWTALKAFPAPCGGRARRGRQRRYS